MKIEINGPNMVYPNGNHALKEVSLTIGNGMFGLLVPNGAGKSTFMRILVTPAKSTIGKKHNRHIENIEKTMGLL